MTSITAVAVVKETQGAAVAARRRPLLHPWHVIALLSALVAAVLAARPIIDIDSYWHVLVGRDIVARHSITSAGADWSIAPIHPHWVSSQWLSEVVMYAATTVAGMRALIVLRVVGLLCVLAGLARLVLRDRRTPWPLLLYVPLTWCAVPALQERPQLASMLMLLWLAPQLDRGLQGRRLAHPATVFVITVLWANLHGYWVLVPASFGLLALARAIDERAPAKARRPVLLAAVATLAGMVTPQGPAGLLDPITFASATKHIQEWQPTTVTEPYSVALLVVAVAVVWCWARSRTRPTIGEVVVVLALLGFATLAMRNIAPAAMLLAPIAARVVDRSARPRTTTTNRLEQRMLGAVLVVMAVAGAAAAGIRVATVRPVPTTEPAAIAAWLAAAPGERRVLDSYNVSGFLLWSAHAPHVRVGVDGRADYYGGAYIDRYLELLNGEGSSQPLLGELAPTDAVLSDGAPMVGELQRMHWRIVMRDAGYVLLTKP